MHISKCVKTIGGRWRSRRRWPAFAVLFQNIFLELIGWRILDIR